MSLKTIDLGLVKAISKGTAAPSNTAMLWYNQNNDLHYYYDTVTLTWLPLIGATITKTYAEVQAAVTGATLLPRANYFVSDRNIILRAGSSNTFESTAVYKAHNVDWQNASGKFLGLWTGTTTITYTSLSGEFDNETVAGSTSGAQGLIVVKTYNTGANVVLLISINGIAFQVGETIVGASSLSSATVESVTTTSVLGGIAVGKIVAWNNTHYQNITGSATIKHPVYDVVNWLALPTTDLTYQVEYDTITYDFALDQIRARSDKRGNIVINTQEYSDDSIANFQWGRTGVHNNLITGAQFYGANAVTAYMHLVVDDSHLQLWETRVIDYSNITTRSTCVMLGNSASSKAMNINHGNVTVWGSANVSNLRCDQYADVRCASGCAISDAYVRHFIATVKNGSSLTFCHLDGGSSGITHTFDGESFDNCIYIKGVTSTFSLTIFQEYNDTVLRNSSGFYGYIYVVVTGGDGLISTLEAANDLFIPLYIIIEPGADQNKLIINATNTSLFYLKDSNSKTLDPTYGDFIVFSGLGGGTFQELDSTILSSTILPTRIDVNLFGVGTKIRLTSGEDLTSGSAVYIKSDGKAWKGSATNNTKSPIIGVSLGKPNAQGFAPSTSTANTIGYVLLTGMLRNDSWNWTVGGVIYMSTSNGVMTQSKPASTDNVVQVVGIALSATVIYVNPSMDYITVT